MTTESLKEKATSFIKMFGSELALEFYHNEIVSIAEGFCQSFTIESLTQAIKDSKAPSVPDSFFEKVREHKSLLGEYDTERLTKIIFEIIDEVRPDLSKVLTSHSDNGATWLYRCIEMVRDRIVNPERYIEEMEKPLTVSVTCDHCHKSFRIFRADAELIKQCPFCGGGGEEKAGLPPGDLVA